MILFTDNGTVYRTATDWPKRLSDRQVHLDRIGRIDELSGVWCVKFEHPFHGLSANVPYYVDSTLNNGEKRQIIGMLDKLNSITGREQDKYLARWYEIIGLDHPRSLSDIELETYRTENQWSDTVAKIEAARADNTLG